MIEYIDLRVAGVEWLLQAFKELEGEEEDPLLKKALLGLTLSLRETGSPEEQELLEFLKRSPNTLAGTSVSPSEADVEALLQELSTFFTLRTEDRLGEILDLEYRLIGRYLVLCFALLYEECEAGIALPLGEKLSIVSYELANKLNKFPNAALSIGHLDHMLKDGSGLLKAIKWLTGRARHQW